MFYDSEMWVICDALRDVPGRAVASKLDSVLKSTAERREFAEHMKASYHAIDARHELHYILRKLSLTPWDFAVRCTYRGKNMVQAALGDTDKALNLAAELYDILDRDFMENSRTSPVANEEWVACWVSDFFYGDEDAMHMDADSEGWL